ncbi:ubiquinol-cytochrome c reductase cytochrome c subunit [Actinomadura pelletieri DSM 43383]|uniref:Cytochrome bc1 complex cytochrome c subunit n=1 Tax=Actinomadura pelletieri DSM 43383 TaxID=1120940 RepID=A0A495QNY5_9ACTN|nr:c-type cytochrome [Actinomadura pelletieri]RKS74646.1 ubiquinol-cytochrome c reductase cytochrome c subunit [Actinomadura pelletieri DSM 43383]
MKRITAWRRRPWAGYAVVLAALAAIGVIYAGFSPQTDRAEATNNAQAAQDLKNGQQLFNKNCASCHGQNAEGTKDADGKPIAPSLIGVGAASVDFQVSTGRMPAANPGAQIPRKEPIPPFDTSIKTDYEEHEEREAAEKQKAQAEKNLRDLNAFIQSLGGGPEVPPASAVDPAKGDVALGGKLFRTNCAQCHNFTGQGGALTGGKYAPPLSGDDVTPTQMYEAMLTGPQAMPVFNDTTLTPKEKQAIIAYLVQTREEPNPGGNGLGRIGPVSEGLVGWLIGIGLLVLAAMWITAKKPKKLKKS